MAYLLHHLLTETTKKFPDKEALRFQTQTLTYRELDQYTNQVAHLLRQVGVKRGDRVGFFLHKSLASVISIFGILKAGGVYVPLDPSAPARRQAYITRNCQIQVLLTSAEKLSAVSEFFDEGTPLETIILMDDSPANEQSAIPEAVSICSWEDCLNQPGSPVPPAGTIETDLAYILYTSGSTGDPKGVMIAHRTIFTFINWCFDRFEMTPQDRVTSHAPFHFDLSTFDLFVTVKVGGTVVLVPEKLSIFPVQLVRLLQDEKITVTYMVPSILTMMVNYGRLNKHDLSHLRTVLFAGEVFPIKYLRQLVEQVPGASYFNLYGPTETNVCTYYEVQPHDLEEDRTEAVPIGVACDNIDVFVVDEDGILVTEPGPEGELWVRGSCVAQGYWGDPEKTAKGFVENVHNPHYREMAYRTGDIVTLDADGRNWRYIGRRDHMIKSRGYRIELGEIETALYSHPNVVEAVVVPLPDEIVGNRIKAFIVMNNGAQPDARTVKAFCLQHLP
ncbi:MAG: amino acid adenylation domain-containing protein, partial [Candidatus Promineifilaceae bacterium]